ncbi:hypothetical protein ACMFMG_005196 [Clarireedia jacksonii]
MSQPEDTVSAHALHEESMGLKYFMPYTFPEVPTLLNFMGDHLRQFSQRSLNTIHQDILLELQENIDSVFSVDGSVWKEVRLLESMEEIGSKPLIRIIYGKEMVENPDFTKNYAKLIFRYNIEATHQRGDVANADLIPRTFLEHIASALVKDKRRSMFDTNDVASVILAKSILTTPTAITAGNVFLDILSSDPREKYYEILREEAYTAYGESNNGTDPSVLSKLVKTDSAIRESMRLNPSFVPWPKRKIVSRNGVTLPDGTNIPYGCWIGTPNYSIQTSEEFYPSPLRYMPFRFVGDSTCAARRDTMENSPDAGIKKCLSMTTTSPTFLAFGLGRHNWYVFLFSILHNIHL